MPTSWEFPVLLSLLLWKLFSCLLKELCSWHQHWQMAEAMGDWQRSHMRTRMKQAGIKFSPRPLSAPLCSLPCRWMVLSHIMLSMWSVAMAGHIPLQPPTTWVSALGEVRALTHAFPLPPPDPPDWYPIPILSPVLESFPAEEGEAAEAPTINQLKPLTPDTKHDWEDWDDWAEFNICKPCSTSPPSTSTVDWSDFN